MKSKNHDLGMAIGKVDLLSFSKVPTYLHTIAAKKLFSKQKCWQNFVTENLFWGNFFLGKEWKKSPIQLFM